MAIFELTAHNIAPLLDTSFEKQGIKERADLQRLLRDQIDVITPRSQGSHGTSAIHTPDILVVTEEFGDWEDSKRRIDLLALDRSANLVVIELKRSEDRGATELQAIRYAAMVSTMTFEQVVSTHKSYLAKRGIDRDSREAILGFLGWDAPDEREFAQTVRIVLVAEDFSKELTSSVMWLNQRDLDIRCVRVKPYTLGERILIDVQQTVPLPEAAEYIVHIKEKTLQVQIAKQSERDFTRYDVTINGEVYESLPKRRAIFRIVKHFCENGIHPDSIEKLLPERSRNWRWVEGDVNREEFVFQSLAMAKSDGRSFEERRWFIGDNELIHAEGRTYALSNQWGGGPTDFANLLDRLIAAFPGFDVSYQERS